MDTNDALARLRQLLPAEMDAIDRMLTRAGFIDSSGRVAPGCDDSVRSLTITRIPPVNKYFHLLAPQCDTAPAILTGCCNSSAASHRNRIHDLYAARDDILALSAQIRDIAQIMLYAGRIHSGELAAAALDVAISIHGQPDDREKAYAQNITLEQVRADGER